MTTQVTAPLRYPGAKWMLAPKIVELMPAHQHYVEPYFGTGAVFFTKPPSLHEVINDANGEVVNLFRTLRDRTDDLLWALETTPWSRQEYESVFDSSTNDELERARQFVVRTWMAHAADLSKKTGWKSQGVRQARAGVSHRWAKVPGQLLALVDRLRDAEIECRPALEVIGRHSGPDVLIYADPPYLPTSRTHPRLYGVEMGAEDHVELLDALETHPGPVVLSGYPSELYDQRLAHWERTQVKAPRTQKGVDRTEVLWAKPTL